MTLWRVRATVDDRPGFLAVLTASLALKAVNILSVQMHGTDAGAVDDFLVDAPNDLTEDELLAAVARGRGRDAWVRRTEAHHLVDPPTEVLSAAIRIVRDPDDLSDALGGILLATVVRYAAPADSYRPGFADTRMQIRDPAGGTLLVERPAPPFTPAEYARARALVELAAEIRRTAGCGGSWRSRTVTRSRSEPRRTPIPTRWTRSTRDVRRRICATGFWADDRRLGCRDRPPPLSSR